MRMFFTNQQSNSDLRRLFVGLVITSWVAASPCESCAEDQFLDDHGDDAANATAISLGGPAVEGNIEMDVDRDFFSFTAQPGKQVVVTAVETGVPDLTVRLRSQAMSGGLLASAHSVDDSQAVLTWANTFGSYPVYVEVISFSQFVSGTYTVQVDEEDVADADGDDLPDVWENMHFGDLDEDRDDDHDVDGLSNYQEYLLGTDPTLAGGGQLEITALHVEGDQKTITWDASPLRRYDVQATTAIDDMAWHSIGTVTSETSSASTVDVNGNEHCLYRIGLLLPK